MLQENFDAIATYDFMQKNDSDICFRWLGDMPHGDTANPLGRPHIYFFLGGGC